MTFPRLLPLLVAALTLPPERPSSLHDATAQPQPAGTVIVANMTGRTTRLVDLASGTVQAEIPSRAAPHEVAVSSDGALAVVTNYGGQGETGNLLQVIDVERGTLRHEHVIDGYERLHGVAFLPGDSLLVLTAERVGQLLVVGAQDGRVRRVLPTEGRATHMLSSTGRWIWAANIVDGTVSRIDATGAQPTRTYPAGERTEGIAATPDGNEGWTGSMSTGEVIAVAASGTAAGDSATTVRISGMRVPYRLAATADGRTIVVSDPAAHELVVIDRRARAITGRIDVGRAAADAGLGGEPSPQGFVLTPDGRFALVSAKNADRIAVVELDTRRVLRFLEAGGGPDGIAYSPRRALRQQSASAARVRRVVATARRSAWRAGA